MSLDEGVSRFIGRLYEAVYDRDEWRAVVAELMRRTGSRLAFISSVDLRHQEYSKLEFHAPELSSVADGVRDYTEELHLSDPSLAWASRHPAATMCDTTKIMPREEFERLPYVTWQRSRFGTTHWRVFYTPPVDQLTFSLSLHPPAEAGPANEETGALHKLLFEHMERALRLAARPADLSNSSDAVLILDDRGHVLSTSPRADQLLGLCDGIGICQRMLETSWPSVTARLNDSILGALDSARVGGPGGAVRIPRLSGKSAWIALVSAYPRFLEHLPVRVPAVLVRIIEPETHPALTPAAAQLFDLTARERDVADALLHGHSLESLCHVLGISRNTAKVHLQSLFRKTATNRQSELVQLLSDVGRC